MSFIPDMTDGTETAPENADVSQIDPAWRSRALEGYTFPPSDKWPTGYIRQSDLNTFARIHPAGQRLDALKAINAQRNRAKADCDQVNEEWLTELRKVYRAGAPARVLAEVTGLSSARISQLVGGARR